MHRIHLPGPLDEERLAANIRIQPHDREKIGRTEKPPWKVEGQGCRITKA
jgi:hypothetical protein